MKVPRLFSAFAAILLLVASASASAAPKATEFIEGVDWTKQVITVTGEGIVPPNALNYTQAKGQAQLAAKADAYRKLGELINGVHVEGETTIEKMLTTQDVIKMRVSATIKGAKLVSENFLSDGGYRVVMQVPLFGVSNSLASAVLEQPKEVEPFPEPIVEVAPSTPQYDSKTPVNRRIEITAQTKVTIEESFTPEEPTQPYVSPLSRKSLSTFDERILQKVQANTLLAEGLTYQPTLSVNSQVAYDASKSQRRRSVREYASSARGNYTGLIVDCRGKRLNPVMSPVIKNSNGTTIYGHKNLNHDRILREGMVAYADDISLVGRAGNNPIVVRAMRTEDFNSNPVLSIPDSNRILIENYTTNFLRDLKVVFLCD